MIQRQFYYEVKGRKLHIKRVSKRKAVKLLETGKTVYMCPCKVNPQSTVGAAFVSTIPPGINFDSYVLNGEYYNCNAQLGAYMAFYVEV